ncbi:hypothetical protein TASIC1_0009014600 [Trichoderma asperellum]|uniref:Uncharacterized protein n=1 Tax=Trichoderma asperellum TaxID=101201 RepID=A0A6V8QZ92_TRIAP|nr:hypothetical protein TASIC1_0009014600 [Trichoderma asperellum]
MSPSLKDINSTILAQGKPAVNPDIPDLPLTDNKPVGGVKSGEPFLSRKGNRPVKSVNFWYTEDRLTAIEISWYFDESTEVYGDISKGTKSKLLKLGPYEIVEHTSVWKTEEGNGIAYIELQTNGVQFFSAGTKPSEGDPVKENLVLERNFEARNWG